MEFAEHRIYSLRNDIVFKQSAFCFKEKTTNQELTDLMELHFIELPKYRRKAHRRLQSRLEKWLYVLRFGEMFASGEPLPEELQQEEGIAMAMKELQQVNADARMRAILEQREKDARDQRMSLKTTDNGSPTPLSRI